MSDMGEVFNGWKQHKKELRNKYGQPCPACQADLPKAQAKILLPGQKCWCGYRDSRVKLSIEQESTEYARRQP